MRYDSYEILIKFKSETHTETKLFVSNESFAHVWDMIYAKKKELKQTYLDATFITEVVNVAESHHVDDDSHKYWDEEPEIDTEN